MMSEHLNTIIEELRGMREDMSNAMELLAIASPAGKPDLSNALNEIIQAAMPFVECYNPHTDSHLDGHEQIAIHVKVRHLRRLIVAISKITDSELETTN